MTCHDCPLAAGGVIMEGAGRFERLVEMRTAGQEVPCHHHVDAESAMRAMAEGKDWRLDSRVVVPCRGVPS